MKRTLRNLSMFTDLQFALFKSYLKDIICIFYEIIYYIIKRDS